MADYIYMMETRLSPDQQRAVAAIQDAALAQGMNVYLTGGAVRDLVSGFAIRDLDFTVQGNALKLQKDLEKSGAVIQGSDEDTRTLALLFPGNVRAEVQMARSEKFDRPGKPIIAAATIIDDLRRRDFTVNAMALSLNPASRGLLLDPANGTADVEGKLLRILHNYSFLEEPSRLLRAIRFSSRFHWPLEERTQARYDAAKENGYIDNISNRTIGYEIEQLAYEDDPLHVMKALEKEGWMKVLHGHWNPGKVDTGGLSQLGKLRLQMTDLGYTVDAAPAVMYFLTARMNERETGELQRLIPHKEFVATWRNLEDDAKELAKRLAGKEAATPSRAWQLLSNARPESILFLELTSRNQSVTQKLRNFLGKWRQVKQKLPLPEMAELYITPELPAYPKLADEAFLLLLDGKLRSRTETLKFLKPYAPPPPPPPPPPPVKRGRAAKAEAAAAPVLVAADGGKGKRKKGGVIELAAVAAPEVPKKPPVSVKVEKQKAGKAAKGAKAGKAKPGKASKAKAAKGKAAKAKPGKSKAAKSKKPKQKPSHKKKR